MAKEVSLTTKQFVDQNSSYFRELTKVLNISNNFFIRTTDKKIHWPGVIHLWNILYKKGDIYKKFYKGCYCYGCERFVTEKDLIDGKCPIHPNLEPELIEEENYFFKLSKYSNKIKELIKKNKLKIIPEKWKNDFLSLIKNGLTDVSFSRDKKHLPWGVPVPGDKNQVMYVWPDALTNYLTGIGYPNKRYKKYWPADLHIVGKDMLRFHTGIWPGMLLSAGIELPKEVIVHGFLTVNGQKMSKSLGNVVNPLELRRKYSADSIRYYLMRTIPFDDDGNFSEEDLISRHNNELADKLGNLVSRTAALIEKYGMEEINKEGLPEKIATQIEEGNLEIKGGINESELNKGKLFGGSHTGFWLISKGEIREFTFKNPKQVSEAIEIYVRKYLDKFELDKALNKIFFLIDYCNWYVQFNELWKKENNQEDLYELKESILKIAELLSPFIPETSEKIKKQFSAKNIKKGEILFKKINQ